MNTIDGNVIGATADPVWVKVAAADSLPAAKSAADFVCAGEHDEETLQAAIDRCAADGRDLFLFDGIYNIDAFREWADGGPRAALRIPVMLRHFTVRGEKFFQAGRGTIPDDKAVWKNGAVLYVRKPARNTTGEAVPSVLRGECTEVASQNGAGLALENVSVFICDTEHPARCVDLRWTDSAQVRNMPLFGAAREIGRDSVSPPRGQSVTMIGCNFERMEYLTIGGKLGDRMRETVPGSWRGRIEYTLMPREGSPQRRRFPRLGKRRERHRLRDREPRAPARRVLRRAPPLRAAPWTDVFRHRPRQASCLHRPGQTPLGRCSGKPGKVIRAKALNYMRFIEEWGLGLRRVNAILRDYGLKDAEMEDAGLAVRSRRARLGI